MFDSLILAGERPEYVKRRSGADGVSDGFQERGPKAIDLAMAAWVHLKMIDKFFSIYDTLNFS